jgi:hypothetical protein
MKSTNEMIADLVAAGFELPEGLVFVTRGDGEWTHSGASLSNRHAYDLIACAFARQVWSAEWGASRARMGGDALEEHDDCLSCGNTEGAIQALWYAVCVEGEQ